jgi:ATP-dependent Lon protease
MHWLQAEVVIGKAWAAKRFSMRTLKAIVRATLEARDQHAMTH